MPTGIINGELTDCPSSGAIVVNVARHALRQYSASLHRVLLKFVVGEGAVSCSIVNCGVREKVPFPVN